MSQVETEAFGRAVSDHREGLDLQDWECGVGHERKVRGAGGRALCSCWARDGM